MLGSFYFKPSVSSWIWRESYGDIELNSRKGLACSVIQAHYYGNTTIEVSGVNFANTSHLSCKFDDVVVPAKYINSSTIQCLSPYLGASCAPAVDIANSVSFSNNNIRLRYDELALRLSGAEQYLEIEGLCSGLSSTGNEAPFSPLWLFSLSLSLYEKKKTTKFFKF